MHNRNMRFFSISREFSFDFETGNHCTATPRAPTMFRQLLTRNVASGQFMARLAEAIQIVGLLCHYSTVLSARLSTETRKYQVSLSGE